MNSRILAASLFAVIAAGCSSYSGPTHNTDVVTLINGTQAYRVQCQGLLGSSNTCLAQVKKICGDKQAVRVSAVDRAASGFKPESDPREMMFTCDEPVVKTVAVQPDPRPVAQVVPAPVIVQKITLQGDTNFAVNSATLTRLATEKLDQFIHANRGIDIDHLTIAGYTDSTGSLSMNNRLSTARASSVQAYLASHGVRAENYDVKGYGSASPVASNATAAGRAKNRRVEIRVDGK